MSMLIRGGHLVDPAAGRDGIYDVLVKDGVIAELAEWSNGEAPVWQEKADTVKLSVRAVPGYDAAAICATFGGGGHKGAAGASMKMSMEEAVEAVKAAMPEI